MVELLRIEPWVEFRDRGWSWTEQFGYPQDSFYTNANTRLEELFGDAPLHIKEFAGRVPKSLTKSIPYSGRRNIKN